MRILLLAVCVGVAMAGPRERRDTCTEEMSNYDTCVKKAHADQTAAMQAGDDGKADFFSRKTCNYINTVVESCIALLEGCYTEEHMVQQQDLLIESVITNLEEGAEWNSDLCPAFKEYKARKAAAAAPAPAAADATAATNDDAAEPAAAGEPADGGVEPADKTDGGEEAQPGAGEGGEDATAGAGEGGEDATAGAGEDGEDATAGAGEGGEGASAGAGDGGEGAGGDESSGRAVALFAPLLLVQVLLV